MAVITVAITMYCYSRLDYACCRIWTCSKWPRNAAKEMFPQNSRLAPLIKGLSSFTGRIQAMYLGQVTIIHQPEIKEKKTIWAGYTQFQPSLRLWCCGEVVIIHPDCPHDLPLNCNQTSDLNLLVYRCFYSFCEFLPFQISIYIYVYVYI